MPRKLNDVYPPPEELLDFDPEEVASLMLDHLCEFEDEKPGNSNLSSFNYTIADSINSYAGDKRIKVGRILMESWNWLENEGMLATYPNESSGTYRFVTRKGFAHRTKKDLDSYRQALKLPKENLDQKLLKNVYPMFLRGDYDTAILQAYKEVEVRVRDKAGLSNNDYGVELIKKAFNPASGILTDPDPNVPPSEKLALYTLFTGSIGTFKNPNSHRNINLNDPSEAAEIILFANYLLKVIDRSPTN